MNLESVSIIRNQQPRPSVLVVGCYIVHSLPRLSYLTYNMIFSALCIFSFCTHACTHACTYTHGTQTSKVTHNSLMDSSSPILSSRQKMKDNAFFHSHAACVLVLLVLRHSPLTMNIMCLESCSYLAHWGKALSWPMGWKIPDSTAWKRVFFLLALCRFNPFSFAKSPCAPSVARWSC